MSVELLKNVIARGAMAKNAASLASHPTVTWKHMSDPAVVAPAVPAVDKKATINALLAPVLGKQAAVAVQPVDKRAIIADLLQKNAGIVTQGLDLGRKGLSFLRRGASYAGNATLSGARQAANFTAAHPVAAIGTAGAAAGLGGGYIGGKVVGYNQGAKDKASQTNDQLARYGVTAGGAALGGIGGNMLAGAFGGGRVARTLATLLGAAGGGAAGYYAMDPAVQAKVKALFS